MTYAVSINKKNLLPYFPLFCLMIAAVVVPKTSHATVSYDAVKTSGSGCPSGSSAISITPGSDQRSLAVGLQDMELTQRRFDTAKVQKECSISVNYHANYDEQYIIHTTDWRLDYALPLQASAKATTEHSISYRDILGNWIESDKMISTRAFIGPRYSSNETSAAIISSQIPDLNKTMECGQSFTLNSKITASLQNLSSTDDADFVVQSLDLAEINGPVTVTKVPCLHPWSAAVEKIDSNYINVKVNTENLKVNQLASLYVVGEYQGQLYALSSTGGVNQWTLLNTESLVIPPLGSAPAPKTFSFQISGLSPTLKGAKIYVGVGYGESESVRLGDLLNTHRYQLVHTIP